jgi:hypothetical protein
MNDFLNAWMIKKGGGALGLLILGVVLLVGNCSGDRKKATHAPEGKATPVLHHVNRWWSR